MHEPLPPVVVEADERLPELRQCLQQRKLQRQQALVVLLGPVAAQGRFERRLLDDDARRVELDCGWMRSVTVSDSAAERVAREGAPRRASIFARPTCLDAAENGSSLAPKSSAPSLPAPPGERDGKSLS